MRLALGTAAALAALSMTGCLLPWDHDDPPPCTGFESGDGADYRNPQNGLCEDLGGGGCDALEVPGGGAATSLAWAACYAGCEGLSEEACIAEPQCRAVYDQEPAGDGTYFYECWGIAPTGPEPGSCEGLDAQGCSTRNDCSAVYNKLYWANGGAALQAPQLDFGYCRFESVGGCYSDDECAPGWDCTADTECLPPPGCGTDGTACPAVCYGRCVQVDSCSNTTCSPGYHCEEQCAPCDPNGGEMCGCAATCVPDINTCDTTTCGPGSHCETYCTGTDQPVPPPDQPMDAGVGGAPGDWEAPVPPLECTTICVPDAPAACAGWVCGPGYHCEDTCAPTSGTGTGSAGVPAEDTLIAPSCPVCVPDVPDPGECYGPVLDWSLPPTCPDGTTPGTLNGSYTGYCIPISECGRDPGSCYGDLLCDSLPPACPMGTVPGISDSCWSGYCIPQWACQGEPCEALDGEEACRSRMDCTPIYRGDTCICDVWGSCTCDNVTFARCEQALFPR